MSGGTGHVDGPGAPPCSHTRRILIVGAGLAGAVYARTLAEAGVQTHVIDRRPHVAGNAYDEVNAHGLRVHRYGPHLFHTSNQAVLAWIKRFADWAPYEHKVRALLPSRSLAPLPINLDTLNLVFGIDLSSSEEARAYLGSISTRNKTPANAAEYLASCIGTTLCDLFFRPYSRKMWGLELEQLSPAVVKRIPLRLDRRDTYFRENETQLLPKDGYTAFVECICDHPLIEVSLNTAFAPGMAEQYHYCFSSMAIDEYYDFRFGQLPYRSLRFHHHHEAFPVVAGPWSGSGEAGFSVINFTDDGPLTRQTAWHRLPYHWVRRSGVVTFTSEEPCDYLDNGMERYYPVKDANEANAATYEKYRRLASADIGKISFIGRCGTYKYLDMDQVINQSLIGAAAWLRSGIADSGAKQSAVS